MFKQNLLKAKLAECGMSTLNLCKQIGMNEATFYRKVARDGDFSRKEIARIADVLSMTPAEKESIFFAI